MVIQPGGPLDIPPDLNAGLPTETKIAMLIREGDFDEHEAQEWIDLTDASVANVRFWARERRFSMRQARQIVHAIEDEDEWMNWLDSSIEPDWVVRCVRAGVSLEEVQREPGLLDEQTLSFLAALNGT